MSKPQTINHIMAGESRFSILTENLENSQNLNDTDLEEVTIYYAWDPKGSENHGTDIIEK